jgi:putative spermidine/putrescine transport system permease protein
MPDRSGQSSMRADAEIRPAEQHKLDETMAAAIQNLSGHVPAVRVRRSDLWLLAPGVIWMTLFLVLPILMMVYVSFWTQTTFKIEPTLTLKSWITFFSSDTYLGSLWTTIRIWLTVLVATVLVGYPAALFVGLFVKNKTLSTVLLVLSVIPFWTSFLIRVLAWRPMLGKEGAINIILMKLGIVSQPIEALLFSELSVIIGMTQIYCVFMVGPVAFMLGRIDPSILEAAQDLGAGFWRTFRTIILPLSMPGVVVGSIFISVMVLGEFATSAALSGRKVNLLGNIIVTQVGSLKWAFAAVAGVVLTILMGAVVAALLRVVDLRKEL